MLLLGLTGSIATGKSTVSKLIASHGIPIIDADKIAHDVVEHGKPGFFAVAQAFPSAVNVSTGALDRGLLGGIIFGNDGARKKLNGILHPLIQAEMLRQVLLCFLSLTPIAVMDAPLLFEVKLHRVVHETIVVYWCVSFYAILPRD
jgi:dephospho-CoA kinase